ncbi:MAG: DHA2 family efflux MFS transporter permease subunit [Actinomycetota bacterium]|nr:MAG: DHA2 family efflux MFS transporter permease subunit [Actinomycetota bacterium]
MTDVEQAGPDEPQRWLALAILCISLLMISLDNTVLNVALPTLVQDMHSTNTQLQWIVDSYLIVYAGLLLSVGSVADRIGRKRVFLSGLVIFALGSTWAAFSGSSGVLTAARALMGLGGAGMMPSTLSIITGMFHRSDERQRAIGVWSATTGIGVAIGPIVGGLLLAHFWWGSVFLINLPIAVIGFVLAVLVLPESRDRSAQRPDPVGAIFSIVGLGFVLWSLIEAPIRGWSSSLVIVAGVVGLGLLTLFVLFERRSSHPMLNLSFFRSRRFSAAVSSVGLVSFGLFGSLFVLTQYLQFNLGYTALQTGIRILPAAAAIAVVAPLSSLMVRFIGTKLTAGTGLVIVAGGLWQISGTTASTTYSGVVVGMIMLGIGMGMVIPSATESVMGSLPGRHTGVGSAVNGTFLQTGGALGVAVIGSLMSTRYQDRIIASLAPFHVPGNVMHIVEGSVGGALGVAAQVGGATGSVLAGLARSAFISGLDLALLVGAGFAFVGALIVFFALPSRPERLEAPVAPKALGKEDQQ